MLALQAFRAGGLCFAEDEWKGAAGEGGAIAGLGRGVYTLLLPTGDFALKLLILLLGALKRGHHGYVSPLLS